MTEIKSEKEFYNACEKKETFIASFSASWCGPCKLLKPIMTQATGKRIGQFLYIDTDKFSDLAKKYSVSSVPTVLAINGGKVVDQFSGYRPHEDIDKFLDKHNFSKK